MNMDKNIIYGKTLSEYKRKYRNCKRNLLFYSKEEVETFDAKFSKSAQVDKVLLQGRKWAYINGTYYEIPKAPGWTWFRNLNSTVQVFTCGLLGAGVVTAVVVPTVMALNKGSKEEKREITIDPSVAHVKCTSEIVDGNLEITLQVEDKYLVYEIESVTINGSKLKKKEFSYDMPTKKVTIKKEVLDKHTSGNVIVKPVVEDDIDFNQYLNFKKIGETNYCEVSGKSVTMPKKLRIPAKVVIEQKEYNVACISDKGFTNSTFNPGSELICPNTLIQIGKEAFDSVSNLKKVVLNDGLKEIGSCFSFYGCKDLEEINIPESLTYDNIANGSFTNCNGLKTVVVDSQSVCESTDECRDLFKNAEIIYVKDTLTVKDDTYISNFYKKAETSDREDYIKYEIKQFDYEVISEVGKTCKINASKSFNLKDVVLPDEIDGYTVTETANDSFRSEKGKITSVSLPSHLTKIGGASFKCQDQVTGIVFNTELKIIGGSAFDSTGLTGKITLNDGLEEIGESAFNNCTGMTSINIPSSVNTITDNTFSSCTSLNTVTVDSKYVACLTANAGLFVSGRKFYILTSITTEHKADFENGYLFKNSSSSGTEGNYTIFTIN